MSLLLKSHYLLNDFTVDSFPPFPCPTCGNVMRLEKKGMLTAEAGESYRSFDVGAIDQPDRFGFFSACLKCDAHECYEVVVVSGEDHLQEIERYDGTPDFETLYSIKYVQPTVHIFPISESCEGLVREHLLRSFSLFWSAPSAAGNSLRCAIESLMDHLKVRKQVINRFNKVQKFTLHARIEEWGRNDLKNKELSKLLLAIKWIGNAGSHKATLTREDVIKAYQLTEHVFSEVFDKKTDLLKKLATRVNQKKGPTK
ncbi:DUF4145 domain-containing protein [Coraliomargarita sp. SDUM461004]|uniref:DUF4145 domain-containing protein n=1 Tax=Thalassobacterium sedimentorum TaxID=3041258 RepID=A0ABU1AGS9_9BACT|nr:DUF4145 domain-containing protein [Coraliomargarita sp. SDUM461004]MDQ8194037.1 DUF4145 domain-containing protein [Coraliomargarita sp. SDUM461004]